MLNFDEEEIPEPISVDIKDSSTIEKIEHYFVQDFDKKGNPIGYHPEMIVTFKPNSVRYLYYNVPREVFNAIIEEKFTNMKGEPSVGATFIKLVRRNDNYKYKILD